MATTRRISNEGYTKPKKPKAPVKPKKPVAGPKRPYSYRPVRANTAPYSAIADGGSTTRFRDITKKDKFTGSSLTSAVGLGGMFSLSPWAKNKTK